MSVTPEPVLDRVRAHLELEADVGGYEAAALVAEELAAVPAAVADLLGAEPDEVFAAESATAASEALLWSAATTFGFSAGDRILVDGFAYSTAYSALRRLELAGGARVDVVDPLPDGRLDVDDLVRRLDERTRLVLVTHMPTHVGVLTDAVAVGRALAGTGALYVLDVAQTVGQLSLDVAAIGCDMAFAPGRKFLRAPRGTGFGFVRAAIADRLQPLTPPFGAVDAHGTIRLPPAARRFDQFEHAVAVRLGLGAAARFATTLGVDRIEAEVADRTRAVVAVVESKPRLRVPSAGPLRAIVPFVHESLDAEEVLRRLTAAGVRAFVSTAAGAPLDRRMAPELPAVRLSPHYTTTPTELERLDAALDALG
jgi:selenocysteine lyase/cysteine desulfurase